MIQGGFIKRSPCSLESQSKGPGLAGRKPLKKRGHKAILWEAFAEKKAERDRDEYELIKCQDWKIGLPRCGMAVYRPDLHHIEGRESAPTLYFAEENLVWLIRQPCHEAAHPNTVSTSSQATDDPPRQVDQQRQGNRPTSSNKVLQMARQPKEYGKGKFGRTVYSSVQNRDASIVERKKEGAI